MATLLLRLEAPMQSWGVQSRYTIRDTSREPSKSGLVGLICAALGRPREADISDLAALRMGVRVDREGRLAWDYQITQRVLKANLSGIKTSEVSTRYYLADAVFLAGLEGDAGILKSVVDAILAPRWVIYLGRKAFVPAKPLVLPEGFRNDECLQSALENYPYLAARQGADLPEYLRAVVDDEAGAESRPDSPLSFQNRSFSTRRVRTYLIKRPEQVLEEEAACTSAD